MTSDGPAGPPEPNSSSGRARPSETARWAAVGDELRALRRNGDDIAGRVRELTDELSRLLPRVDELDTGLAELSGMVAAAGRGGDGADPAQVPGRDLTPAIGWSELAPQARQAAWDALGDWVADVLNHEYRLSRAELPDCWALHPRAVRELAWLRTLHRDCAAADTRPDQVAEWHTRWLPAAITNVAAAIDPRECVPGRHRLTEDEQRAHETAIDAAARNGDPPPALTTETGPDRPRYRPECFPPRRSSDHSYATTSQRPRALDAATPAPASIRDDWWELFLDARLADLGQHQGHPPT
ncbi:MULTISPECIES: hypothetical protein [Pseudonocardia]|uniref:DUF4913 domain-containing protein n=1 Tax=Pseudonocardia autotrophica TaxID=2074 RepID=A0A1Y2MLR6_PSEAH|nr:MULTISPECIES: hypothetical protein [Pseudonocardia]OSY35991.1 hypothetical protein BG845_05672 [Pseudonocardia autotrophica]TDN65624.1 hypothetical protein C8E95_7132 [Pseudonocardia autotrophica]